MKIALTNPQEESALPMAGKKRTLKRSEFLEYARTRLKLTDSIIAGVFQELAEGLVHWNSLIRQLERQGVGCLQCLTEEQWAIAGERQRGSGERQAAYARVRALR